MPYFQGGTYRYLMLQSLVQFYLIYLSEDVHGFMQNTAPITKQTLSIIRLEKCIHLISWVIFTLLMQVLRCRVTYLQTDEEHILSKFKHCHAHLNSTTKCVTWCKSSSKPSSLVTYDLVCISQFVNKPVLTVTKPIVKLRMTGYVYVQLGRLH